MKEAFPVPTHLDSSAALTHMILRVLLDNTNSDAILEESEGKHQACGPCACLYALSAVMACRLEDRTHYKDGENISRRH